MRYHGLRSFKLEHGFSILESLLAFACITLLISVTSAFVAKRVKEQNILSIQAAKSRIIHNMELAFTDPHNIKVSIEQTNGPHGSANAQLRNCILFGSMCPASFLDANAPQQMDFYMPDGKGGSTRMSSSWSRDGKPLCSPLDKASDCPFIVTVKYWFTCRPTYTGLPPVNCMDTSQMNIVLEMSPYNAQEASAKGLNLYHPTTPTGGPVNYKSFAYSLDVNDLRVQLANQSCKTDQYFSAYDASGKVICKCTNNRPKKDANGNLILDSLGRPSCDDNVCAADQYLRGIKSDGSVDCANNDCLPPASTVPAPFSCPTGYWVTNLEYTSCVTDQSEIVINNKKKGGSKSSVTCNVMATCCRRF